MGGISGWKYYDSTIRFDYKIILLISGSKFAQKFIYNLRFFFSFLRKRVNTTFNYHPSSWDKIYIFVWASSDRDVSEGFSLLNSRVVHVDLCFNFLVTTDIIFLHLEDCILHVQYDFQRSATSAKLLYLISNTTYSNIRFSSIRRSSLAACRLPPTMAGYIYISAFFWPKIKWYKEKLTSVPGVVADWAWKLVDNDLAAIRSSFVALRIGTVPKGHASMSSKPITGGVDDNKWPPLSTFFVVPCRKLGLLWRNDNSYPKEDEWIYEGFPDRVVNYHQDELYLNLMIFQQRVVKGQLLFDIDTINYMSMCCLRN